MPVIFASKPSTARTGEVERLALRHALGDVEQDDVAKFAMRREVGQGSADHSGADEGDFLASHVSWCFPLVVGGRRGNAPRIWRRSRPRVGSRATGPAPQIL